MKLLKLEILNLASLDKPDGEVIDFEKGALGESTIFSIVGPTGSGKSTLLDAICLALYNRAPRYPRRKGERNQSIEIFGAPDDSERYRLSATDCRNILTRGKKSGYSKLTFRANNGSIYRAEWHVVFQRVRYDSAVTSLYRLVAHDNDIEEQVADWNELPQIIGLDYEQFLRTVLIAQGSFANFLNAKENERYELLEKLIGNEETYAAIAREIKQRKDAAVEAYTTIQAEVEAVRQQMLTDEQLAALNEEITRLEKAENEVTDRLKVIDVALAWYADDDKLQAAIRQQQLAAEQARQQLAAMNEQAARLQLHDVLAPAVDMLREVKRLESAIAQLQQAMADRRRQIAAQQTVIDSEGRQLTTLKTAAEEAQHALEAATPHILKARELRTQMQAARQLLGERLQAKTTAEREQAEATSALSRNTTDTAKATAACAKAADELTLLQASVKEKKLKLAMAAVAAEEALANEKKKVEGSDANELQSQKSLADKAVADIKRATDNARNTEEALSEQQVLQVRTTALTNEDTTNAKALDALTIEALTTEVETLRRTHTLMTSENWGHHRHHLQDGKPCPLCGALDHPYRHDSSRFDEAATDLSRLLQSKEEALRLQMKQKEELVAKQKANERELTGIKRRQAQLSSALAALQQERRQLLTVYPDLPATPADMAPLATAWLARQQQADEALKLFNKVQTAITQLTEQKDRALRAQADFEQQANTLVQKAQKQANDAQTELEKLRALSPTLAAQLQLKQQAVATALANWQQAQEALTTLDAAYKAELRGADPDETERRLKQAKDQADRAVTLKTEALNRLTTQLGQANGALQTQQAQLATEQSALAAKNAELTDWLASHPAPSSPLTAPSSFTGEYYSPTLADVTAMLTATDDWDALRRELDNRRAALTSASALLENARKQHADHLTSKPQQTRNELSADRLDWQSKSHQQDLIAAKARKAAHDQAVALLGARLDAVNRATQQRNDWLQITDAIGPDGRTLRKIAQCYTLRFLIAHANAEIRKFNSRYELLQVKNSLGIRVIDHDRADDIRDTTSLSGGETFIVSLGLALGLSSLSSRNVSFENLFIDEGFGTLDPDMLATVIDALAMLQSSQGKKVGVISHTDVMSERITTQIRIVKNGHSGSSHIELYP